MEYAFAPTGSGEAKTMITRDDIEACTSVPQMLEWLGALEDTKGDIISSLEARKLAETDDDDWAIRASDALTYASMGVKRIKRKLRALGVNPDPMTEDDRKSLERARGAARFAKHLLSAMGARLSQQMFDDIRNDAQAKLLEEGA